MWLSNNVWSFGRTRSLDVTAASLPLGHSIGGPPWQFAGNKLYSWGSGRYCESKLSCLRTQHIDPDQCEPGHSNLTRCQTTAPVTIQEPGNKGDSWPLSAIKGSYTIFFFSVARRRNMSWELRTLYHYIGERLYRPLQASKFRTQQRISG